MNDFYSLKNSKSENENNLKSGLAKHKHRQPVNSGKNVPYQTSKILRKVNKEPSNKNVLGCITEDLNKYLNLDEQ